MTNIHLKHTEDSETRANKMRVEVTSEKKLQHKMINSAPSFAETQDLYLNSLNEWFYHPKCKIALDSKGEDF